MNYHKIEESFAAVYGPIAKSIGECLLHLGDIPIDATAVTSAIIAVAIDIAAKADNLSIKYHGKRLINGDHIARFAALYLSDNLKLDPEIKKNLDAVVLANLPSKEVN